MERSPWMSVFKAMIHSGYHGNTADVIATVQAMPDPGLTKNVSFWEDDNEPHHEKTNILQMRKQRRRSALW